MLDGGLYTVKSRIVMLAVGTMSGRYVGIDGTQLGKKRLKAIKSKDVMEQERVIVGRTVA